MSSSRDSLPRLKDVLATIDSQPYCGLFLPEDEDWSLDSPCAVLSTDDLDDDDDLPALARELHLQHTLQISDLQDIRSNAAAQLGAVTLEQFFDAFLYYYDNDAYKDFGRLYDPSPLA